MALTKDYTGYYLEPSTGQYYSPNNTSSYATGNAIFDALNPQLRNFMMPFIMTQGHRVPSQTMSEGMIYEGGKYYEPFTGNAAGISQGKRSVVDAMIGGRQPYEYNVPSLASLFPSMQGATQTAAMPQGNAGAGRFMGGLLGSMPTPVSTTTTQAPSSSGAGRYL
jgi:hypothetical protein